MRARLHDLFGRDQVDQQQAQRDQAERDHYDANVNNARQQIAAVVEGDPRVQQARHDAQQHSFNEQQARANAAQHRADAATAHADANNARHQADQVRQHANQLDPAHPQRDPMRQYADQLDAYANQRTADAQQAEANAGKADQQAQHERNQVAEANKRADEVSQQVRRDHPQLWHWANIGLEGGHRLVGPDHPGPEISALTGHDSPPPVWRSRPYGTEFGLRHVLHVDQQRLQDALSDGQGGYHRAADPKGPWLKLINAFAFHVDPTRTQNCLDTVAALFDTFVHGRPTVAAPRTFDGYSNGNPHVPWSGEDGGPARMEDLTGGRYQSVLGDVSHLTPDQARSSVGNGFDQIRQQLLAGGHGSFSSIITGWRGGASHAWAAVNYQGVVHFIDPQAGQVVVAVDGPSGGTRYFDAETGQPVHDPIHRQDSISAMDALVVDRNGQPMPFADRPAGFWNDRPLTPEYIAHQPPSVRSSLDAVADHGAARTAHQQASTHADQANQMRQQAQQHAADGDAARARMQDAANRSAVHQNQRDADWTEAGRRDQAAQQHDHAAQRYAEQGRHAEAQQHRDAAVRDRHDAAQLRNRAHHQEGLRQQADLQHQRANEAASNADIRRNQATQAAHQHDQAARQQEQRATQLENRYGQHADQAANGHHQDAARARAEAAQHTQKANQHPPNDPVRVAEERRAQHQQQLADRAQQAGDHYRVASDRQNSALAHDQAANQHAHQAGQHRQQAHAHEQAAQVHEQHRSAAAERAQQMSTVDPKAADAHRAEADQHAAARDQARAQAAHEHQLAHAADQAATAERTAATADRSTRDAFHDAAEQWRDSIRNEQLRDPGTPTPESGAPRQFRPEDLPGPLRSRYDSLTDPRAREQFERMFHGTGNEQRLGSALDGIERKAQQTGGTLETALIEKFEQLEARSQVHPPSPEVLHEINNQLRSIDGVRARIESFARENPDVVGVDRWQRVLDAEARSLQAEARDGRVASVERAQDHGNNVRGVEGELDLAARSEGVVEVGRKVTTKAPDGTVYKTDVDVVAERGLVWRDSKNYNLFTRDMSTFTKLKEQLERQLNIIAHSVDHHVDGQPPRLEWHFPRGVRPDVAAALEALRIFDPVTGAELPHRVTIVGDRLTGAFHPTHPPAGDPPSGTPIRPDSSAPGRAEQAPGRTVHPRFPDDGPSAGDRQGVPPGDAAGPRPDRADLDQPRADRADLDQRGERGLDADPGLLGPVHDAPRDGRPESTTDTPTGPLRILAFDGGREGTGLVTDLSTGLGRIGDSVAIRTPDVPSRDLGPGVRILGADPLPGITGPLSPLLRLDGMPADVDVILGYGETAGIADVRRDAYPDARVVQVLDRVPHDPEHLAVIARADLVVAVGHDVATRLSSMLHDLGLQRTPPVHEIPPGANGRPDAGSLHDAIHGLGDRVARVDEATWRQELNPREVVLRRAGHPPPPADGTLRVMTTCTEWWSTRGGVPTANRELTEAFGAAGAETYARVSLVDGADPARTQAEPAQGVHVRGVQQVWGVLDAKGEPDTRAMLMLLDNLPPHVDVVIGHSRFSGGAARWLVDNVYPDAQYVHVLHTSPEVLDALRGNAAEGLAHARTERLLMAGADMVAGVGPLLGQEAARLSSDAGGVPPLVHQIISDMPAIEGNPPPRPTDRQHFEINVRGRADDPIKGIEFAARVVAELRASGVDVRLTVRGAPTLSAAEAQARQLSEIAGVDVEVRRFTTSEGELLADLHNADLAIMPSIHEGFGLVASEAARAGVPVIVGEGTGAGLFFGNPDLVPAGLGEAATVRDGATVEALRDALAAATRADGTLDPEAVRTVLEQIHERRLPVWTEHVRGVLENLSTQRERALALRDYLDAHFPPGNAAQQLLNAMHGHPTAAAPAAAPPSAPATTTSRPEAGEAPPAEPGVARTQ